jgi:hypothetical protein
MAKRYPESVKQSVCKQILDGSYSLAEIAKIKSVSLVLTILPEKLSKTYLDEIALLEGE